MTDDCPAFREEPRSALVLNSDSASLPIPGGSVDAVVTDPPYFDFVHYSELSDFFFAWLSPVLRDTYPCFARPHSGDAGEVQDNCPDAFAVNLGRVFGECHRVLKADGLLVFSFHHSKPAGWLAIYRAVTQAGFVMVAAHPVKAEMAGSSPKAASRNPINLDAILVCKKANPCTGSAGRVAGDARSRLEGYLRRFSGAGRVLTLGDQWVVHASQVLVLASLARIPDEQVAPLLDDVFSMDLIAQSTPAPQPSPRTPAQLALFERGHGYSPER